MDFKVIIFFCLCFISNKIYSQLGFCQGNSGYPIFTETFGTGTNYGPPLPAGTTTYTFSGTPGPQDGQYTIGRNTFSYGWNLPSDHTPGDTNGKCLIVNASYTAGEFYKTTINGLCENTTYEFSSWLINILPSAACASNGIPINVSFEIWDVTDTNLLASGSTGSINGSTSPNWQQYGLVFQTLAAQTSVILKMKNNGIGGCGNDLAIDDIVFRSCGDLIAVEDTNNNSEIEICSSQTPYNDTITAVTDNAVFSNHFYQWQQSPDGNSWSDMIGETNAVLNISGVTTTTYYKAKVAEYQSNLSNSDCITFSDTYIITVNQAPSAPVTECWEVATIDATTCTWVVTGTQPTQPTGLDCWQTTTFNTTTCSWDITGTQPVQPTTECWENATFNTTTCSWEVTGTQPVQPTTECWENATFNTTTCSWEVTGTQPTQPTGLDCWQTTTFNTTTCSWDITGTQPVQPTTECWENATFNTITCSWEVTGTQPTQPTGLNCWQTANFNTTTCMWEVTGTQPVQPTTECWETTNFNTTTCSWEVTGTQPVEPTTECWETTTFNSTTCSWSVTGTQPLQPSGLECWQMATFNTTTCVWDITGNQDVTVRDETLQLCENSELILNANTSIANAIYLWNTNEQTSSITINSAGVYTVEATDGCIAEQVTFNVELIEVPIIESITSDEKAIIVNIQNAGNYEFSLDGVNYQTSPVFNNIPTGLYTIYVKSPNCDFVVTQEYLHFYIQKFFTPNNDGRHDYFEINILQYFSSSEVYIFNRYGKLLYYTENTDVYWDGTLNNAPLPTSDYWYLIRIEDKTFKGHFSLKR